MSTITKEWLQQKIADMEAARDEIPFGLDEDDSNTLAALRIALASLEAEAVAYVDPFAFHNFSVYRAGETDNKRMGREWMWANPDAGLIPVYTSPPAPVTINAEPVAWLWSHRKHPSEVTLVRPEDDERAEGAHWSGWSCRALYEAPPAPVSVPDENGLLPCPFCGGRPEEDAGGCSEYDGHEHQDYSINCKSCGAEVYCAVGLFERADIPCSCHHSAREVCVEKWNRRAAMLQGADRNSPVIPDGYALVPVEPTMEILDEFDSIIDHGAEDSKEAWSRLIAAAPQQEVKNG